MAGSKANNNNSETRDVRITTSKHAWAVFDAWRQRRGCQSLAEGMRAAMHEVVRNEPALSSVHSQPLGTAEITNPSAE